MKDVSRDFLTIFAKEFRKRESRSVSSARGKSPQTSRSTQPTHFVLPQAPKIFGLNYLFLSGIRLRGFRPPGKRIPGVIRARRDRRNPRGDSPSSICGRWRCARAASVSWRSLSAKCSRSSCHGRRANCCRWPRGRRRISKPPVSLWSLSVFVRTSAANSRTESVSLLPRSGFPDRTWTYHCMGVPVGEVSESDLHLLLRFGRLEILRRLAVALSDALQPESQSRRRWDRLPPHHVPEMSEAEAADESGENLPGRLARSGHYLGLVTALAWCSSWVGANGSTWIIFSYMSFLSFGFSFAFDNSSSR